MVQVYWDTPKWNKGIISWDGGSTENRREEKEVSMRTEEKMRNDLNNLCFNL